MDVNQNPKYNVLDKCITFRWLDQISQRWECAVTWYHICMYCLTVKSCHLWPVATDKIHPEHNWHSNLMKSFYVLCFIGTFLTVTAINTPFISINIIITASDLFKIAYDLISKYNYIWCITLCNMLPSVFYHLSLCLPIFHLDASQNNLVCKTTESFQTF